MPNSVSSHGSLPSPPDSLPSLSDHDSIRSGASTSTHSSLNSAYWGNKPDTLASGTGSTPYEKHDMHSTHISSRDADRASDLNRSSTIKASKHSAASTNSRPSLHDAYLDLGEAAPRLSISSSGSGSTGDLATPDNQHQAWPYDDMAEDGSALAALQASSSSYGTDSRPPSRKVDAISTSLDRLAIQRPAKLERLSSSATNATARDSTRSDEAPSTATQSPRTFQAPDLSLLRMSASLESSAQKASTLDTDIPSRACMTSPDSWRSLLPEHDPYFASEGSLRASQTFRSASPSSIILSTKTSPRAPATDRMSCSSFDTTRTSFSSSISGYSALSMSMAGPSRSSRDTQDSARSDSWRSLLPDDDRYHASRDVSCPQKGLEASPSLASPSLSDHLDSPSSCDGSNHRSAFFALHAPRPATGNVVTASSSSEQDSAARRHSSFSSVEPNKSNQYAATRFGLFGTSASSSDNYVGAPAVSVVSPEAPSMTPELSNSNSAIDDSSERDSWPTNRGGCGSGQFGGSSSPVSSGPMTPEAGQTPHSKSSLAAVLAQEQGAMARVDSPAHVSETSESFVRPTRDGLLATTTTTTTKTTLSTTTQLLSEPASTSSSSAATATKPRTSSCSISTPIDPPSLPFLERRPAPPETDLVIETERHRYTLVTRLPGFSLDCITLATKQNKHHNGRTLHIVADKWDTEGGGHFERRITFPDKECDLKNVKAEFDGSVLKVYVPRNKLGGWSWGKG